MVKGGMHGKGGVCMAKGGVHGMEPPMRYGWSMRGRYAFYWNAFLFKSQSTFAIELYLSIAKYY